MEASALPASVGLGRTRIAIGASLLRIRSDEQLVSFFREGNDDAFRVIHDRYRPRLWAYTRQMLAGSGQDPEDAVQEIFVRAYHGLRANNRELALRAWLYRIAHNRCIDELRRPQTMTVDTLDTLVPNVQDPVARAEQRDALRRLIADVQRLPDQQRSALLMRELSGMTYADVSGALGVTVPAVKSLLVRARVSLAQASEARNTACAKIREDLIVSHDRGVRTSGLARRHMRDCPDCRQFRSEVRGVNRGLAALAPTLGPLGVVANLLGFGGGSAAGGGAVASGGAAGGSAAAGAAGTGAVASTGLLAGGATHVVTLLAAAVVTAGGAVELHNTLASHHRRAHHQPPAIVHRAAPPPTTAQTGGAALVPSVATRNGNSVANAANTSNQRATSPGTTAAAVTGSHTATGSARRQQPLTMILDPDNLQYATQTGSVSNVAGGTGAATGSPSPSAGTSIPGTTGPGTSGPGATGTSGSGTTATSGPAIGTSSTATSSPSGSATSTSSSSSSTGSVTAGSTTAGAATGTPATASSSSSTTAGANTGSTTGSSVGSSGTSTNASKVLNLVTTRHRRRHRVLVGRLL